MTKIFTDRNSSLKRQLLFLTRADLFASVLHGVLYSELVVCLALFCEPAVRGGDGSSSQLSLRHTGSGSTGLVEASVATTGPHLGFGF